MNLERMNLAYTHTLHKSGQACACPLGSWPLPCIRRKDKDRVPCGMVRVQTHTAFTSCKEIELTKGSCFQSTAVPIPQLHPNAASDPPTHHAVNHQHPVLLPEVPVLAKQLRLADGIRMLFVESLLPLELLVEQVALDLSMACADLDTSSRIG
jgi:hypothetical protein